jgi:hypothetical protein
VKSSIVRMLWLAAWCGWAWLGVGLHRELPRDLGPVVCKLSISKEESPVRFVKNTSLVLVQPYDRRQSVRFRIFDAKDGSLVREIDRPEMQMCGHLSTCGTHGVLFAAVNPTARFDAVANPLGRESGFYVVDLGTGKWKLLAATNAYGVELHPTNPWAAFREYVPPAGSSRNDQVVVDWTSGAEVFRLRNEDRNPFASPAFFIGDTDRLIVSRHVSDLTRKSSDPVDLEIWRIAEPSVLEKTVHLPWFGGLAKAANTGRIAWSNAGDKACFDVFDLDSERMLLSVPPVGERTPSSTRGYVGHLRLSANGRCIFGGSPPCLWSVDKGGLQWTPEKHQFADYSQGEHSFVVREQWERWFGSNQPGRWSTSAFRNIEDGRLLARFWERDSSAFWRSSSDGKLCIAGGNVHELPFRVNWPLLAACQSILAAPLVLLWAFLRWRRKRKERLQRGLDA